MIDVDKLKESFTEEQWRALEAHVASKLKLGRSTSSKNVGIISDMHVGSNMALYSGYGPARISPDQVKLRDWWSHCIDKIGHVNVLLLNGEPINGTNVKQGGFQNWSSDLNDQLGDAERLIKEWKYENFVMTRGSEYHTQQGWTNYEETLAAKLDATPYSGMFHNATKQYTDTKGRVLLQETKSYDGISYADKRTDYYIFFEIYGRLFNATHHIGFNRWFAYRTTAIAREMADMEFARGKYYGFNRDLDVIIRSHVHYFVHVEYGNSHGFTTPAWKFPDMHLFRGGLGGTYPTVGAIEVIVEQNGDMEIKKHIMPIKKLPKPKVLHF